MWGQVEPGNEHTLLSSCGDGGFATWDTRKLGPKMKPVAAASHSKTCCSAYFSPAGEDMRSQPPAHAERPPARPADGSHA